MNSFNQYGNGAVVEWLYRYAAGIDVVPGSVGFERILLRPHPSAQLGSLDCRFHSARGEIRSGWEVTGDRVQIGIAVPPEHGRRGPPPRNDSQQR